ncbi:HEAT repeat domain-containing protein [Kouleothrix sp.]|uniref:HEAT repeat domain-containing protein n=1 Tax=Kouleothrix sp. TaxID=2779161 RepID=UPI00391AC51F
MPTKSYQPIDVLRLLEPPTASDLAEINPYFRQTGQLHSKHGYILKRQIQAHTTVRTLVESLQACQHPHTCRILCELLGQRRARSAIPSLLACLTHPDAGVRYEAADALAKIRQPATGPILMHHLASESDIDVQAMLVLAIGAVGYRPAISRLIDALSATEAQLRGSAAWSLGALRACEAYPALEHALRQETEVYPREQIAHALAACSSESIE